MKILFVCTGNVFRSMSAEVLVKKYLKDNKIENIEVSSAGIRTEISGDCYPETIEGIKRYGCEPPIDRRKQITKEICKDKDLIICMTTWHQEYVKKLGFDSVLFNEIAYNKKENLLDEAEYGEKYGWDYDLKEYIYKTIDYIHDAIPLILNNLERFI